MNKWQEFKSKTTKGHIVWSAIISIAILSVSYMICNTSVPLPNEMQVLQLFDKVKSIIGLNKDSIPDEVLLVNVSFDKQLVDYEKNGMPVGQYAITDRQKLLDFLRIAQKTGDYRYILLDVIFEEGISSPQDSALFHQIASMDRIVIPMHKEVGLQDSILYQKAAYADYTVTVQETNFARFKYLRNGQPSIPLKMYQELDGKDITKHGLFYTSDNWICQNGLTLQLPFKVADELEQEDWRYYYSVIQLGVDLLAVDSIWPVAKQIKDKIVVIGDFEIDIHDTYVGPMPGSVICLNAYYALKRGDHIIWGTWGLRLIFYILIAFIYFVTTLLGFNGFSFFTLVQRPWLKTVLSLVKIGVIYWAIAVIGYIFFNTVFNFWLPIVIFSTIEIVKKIIRFIKKKEI